METRFVFVAAISLAAGVMMFQLAGFGALYAGQSTGDQLDSAGALNDSASDSVVDENFTGDATAQDGSLIGIIISGIDAIFSFVGFVVLLPLELFELGIPRWATTAIGAIISILASIGLIQFATNRVFQ